MPHFPIPPRHRHQRPETDGHQALTTERPEPHSLGSGLVLKSTDIAARRPVLRSTPNTQASTSATRNSSSIGHSKSDCSRTVQGHSPNGIRDTLYIRLEGWRIALDFLCTREVLDYSPLPEAGSVCRSPRSTFTIDSITRGSPLVLTSDQIPHQVKRSSCQSQPQRRTIHRESHTQFGFDWVPGEYLNTLLPSMIHVDDSQGSTVSKGCWISVTTVP